MVVTGYIEVWFCAHSAHLPTLCAGRPSCTFHFMQHVQIETWDVAKQRRGPNWKLAQFFTYWHARQEHIARQAQQNGQQQPTVAAGGCASRVVFAASDGGGRWCFGKGGRRWQTGRQAQQNSQQQLVSSSSRRNGGRSSRLCWVADTYG